MGADGGVGDVGTRYLSGYACVSRNQSEKALFWRRLSYSYHSIMVSKSAQKCGKGYEPRHDKTNKVSVRPAKTQISLGIRPV